MMCINNIHCLLIQNEAVDFVLSKFNCIVNLGVGCGKTLVSITAAKRILLLKPETKIVILTTKSSWGVFTNTFLV